jgi:quercetin dioxygenase-like cupin family protein
MYTYSEIRLDAIASLRHHHAITTYDGERIMKFLTYIPFLLTASALFPAFCDAAAAEKAEVFSRQSLLNKAITLPSPRIEAQVIKVHFPPGFKTPSHTHEGPGPRYVLKGKLRVQDSGEDHVYQAGQVFWESGSRMTVENVGEGEAEIVIFQMAPAK